MKIYFTLDNNRISSYSTIPMDCGDDTQYKVETDIEYDKLSKCEFVDGKLVYNDAYEVEDIIFESETSKGSFYHYFDGKDALLSSLSVLFDERYEELMQQDHSEKTAVELLSYLNRELFVTIENTVSIDLLARLFSSQLVTRGEKHLLDRQRTYFKLLRQIVSSSW